MVSWHCMFLQKITAKLQEIVLIFRSAPDDAQDNKAYHNYYGHAMGMIQQL